MPLPDFCQLAVALWGSFESAVLKARKPVRINATASQRKGSEGASV